MLTYDKKQGGFVISLAGDSESIWTPEYGRSIDLYCNVPTTWI